MAASGHNPGLVCFRPLWVNRRFVTNVPEFPVLMVSRMSYNSVLDFLPLHGIRFPAMREEILYDLSDTL